MPQIRPSEVVLMLRESYADVADHTAVGGDRDLRVLSGIIAAAGQIPAELIPRHLASKLAAVRGTIQSAIRSWEIDSRRHHISGREVRELMNVLGQCPDERKWIERKQGGYVLAEPRPQTVDEIRGGMAQASTIMASCSGAGAPAYEQANVIWKMLDADLRIELARGPARHQELSPAASSDATIEPQVESALLDPLVLLRNRRAFDADGPRLIGAAQSAGRPFALVWFDVDHFKQVNDDHGSHAVGDEALKAIADIAKACVEGKGITYRVGGDEFALILPNHIEQEALAVAERLRIAVNQAPLTSRSLTLSVSVGVATFPSNGADFETLKSAADSASYDAKNRHRNLVRVFGEAGPTVTTREPERKEPEAGGLTLEERRTIRLNYFRDRVARCPRDEAILDVEDTTSMGQKTNSIYVSCPLCGLSEELD